MNNPILLNDDIGEFAEVAIPIAGPLFNSVATGLGYFSGTNIWNPIGWAACALLVTAVVVGVSVAAYNRYQENKAKAIDDAHAAVIDTVRRDSKVRYWKANRTKGYIKIGEPITFEQAVQEVIKRRDVFTVTRAEAEAVAIAAGGRTDKVPKGPEIDKGKEGTKGYYNHYHTHDRNGAHVFFLF